MKKSDVRVGMKVVPFKKSVSFHGGVMLIDKNKKEELEESYCWNEVKNTRKPYLYVKQFESEEGIEYVHLGVERGESGAADFFLPQDFRPYVPKRLLK